MNMKAPTLGKLIDTLHDIREKRRELAEKDKLLSAQYAEAEAALMQRLDAEGTTKSTGKKATVSITEVVVANVNWDLAWPLIAKNPQLVQRRCSDPAFRELYEQKGEKFMAKYGFTPFVKRNLNLRNV